MLHSTLRKNDPGTRLAEGRVVMLKISKEYEEFLAEMAKRTPQEIIDKAYEIVIKNDIVEIVENYLSKEASQLSDIPNPLHYLYLEWLDNDYSYMDDLIASITESIKTCEQLCREFGIIDGFDDAQYTD
jgi:hypothetical protein